MWVRLEYSLHSRFHEVFRDVYFQSKHSYTRSTWVAFSPHEKRDILLQEKYLLHFLDDLLFPRVCFWYSSELHYTLLAHVLFCVFDPYRGTVVSLYLSEHFLWFASFTLLMFLIDFPLRNLTQVLWDSFWGIFCGGMYHLAHYIFSFPIRRLSDAIL